MSANSASIILRPAEPDDEPFLFELYADTRADELAAWGWNQAQQEVFLRLQFNAQRRGYEMQYAEADHHVIIFNDQHAGRMIVSRTQEEILFIDIALLAQYRNKGIGTSLIRGLCEEAERKALPLRLHVLKSNGAAQRLYKRLGFSTTGESSSHFLMEWPPLRP
ncbi:MAG TPA: GNAT family N-acetyltransferase [Pyrinomonadaceae bacterium]